ncbi:MAG: hypothetical protein CND43_02210 [Flavobacteriales bacterium MED-G15]|nr:MAG: hypothetical protein CND43_02210 [Flavobacteriales bacterium MED-G15]
MRPQFSLIIFILLSINVFGQTIQSWNTINVKGKLSDKFQIAVEPESRFSDKLEYFHLDFGLIYLLNKKFKIGGYYREIFEIKSELRVREIRPHIDIFYTVSRSFKIRICNEYQIKELTNNNWRIRFRPTYKLNINKWFFPFIQTEPFFNAKGFTRNRFNIGPGFVIDKFWLKPGYMLQTDLKNKRVKQTHIFWINAGIIFN